MAKYVVNKLTNWQCQFFRNNPQLFEKRNQNRIGQVIKGLIICPDIP